MVHLYDPGPASEPDQVILDAAAHDRPVLGTLDTDFGAIVAHSGARLPRTVPFRGDVTRPPVGQAKLLQANLKLADDLGEGPVVVIGDDRIHVRRLPIEP